MNKHMMFDNNHTLKIIISRAYKIERVASDRYREKGRKRKCSYQLRCYQKLMWGRKKNRWWAPRGGVGTCWGWWGGSWCTDHWSSGGEEKWRMTRHMRGKLRIYRTLGAVGRRDHRQNPRSVLKVVAHACWTLPMFPLPFQGKQKVTNPSINLDRWLRKLERD